jgi:hypothetical protein
LNLSLSAVMCAGHVPCRPRYPATQMRVIIAQAHASAPPLVPLRRAGQPGRNRSALIHARSTPASRLDARQARGRAKTFLPGCSKRLGRSVRHAALACESARRGCITSYRRSVPASLDTDSPCLRSRYRPARAS